jgi:hypothetical protein
LRLFVDEYKCTCLHADGKVLLRGNQGPRQQVSKDHSKFSTPPLESLWWRADISKEDVRWVRQHLGHFSDGAKAFGVFPELGHLGGAPIASAWPSRVHFFDGERAPQIQIPLGEKYDYREEYRRARREGDAHLSPHGMFRDLEDGYHEHAMQFMQRFGPLTWRVTTGRPGEEGWVDLSDFWDKHARFVGVSKLWESRFDEEALKGAWRWVYRRLNRIDRVGPARFGAMPNWNFDKYYGFPGRFPWETDGGIEEGLQYPSLLMTTHDIVHYELNLHTQECRQIWVMQSVSDGEDVRFEPIRSYGSLWGAIWDLFGQDISTMTHEWRVCLECAKRFYPKDHRSVCCTSRHQALWSKRKWAREHRTPRMLSKPKT